MPCSAPLWDGGDGRGARIRTEGLLLPKQARFAFFTPKLPVSCHNLGHLGVVLNESNSR
jgi:hypothetical protein